MSCSGVGLAWETWSARLRCFGPSSPRSAVPAPGSVVADHCRASLAAVALYASVVPRDRGGDVPLPPHHQVRGELDLPEAWGPPHAARRSPGPASWDSWRGDDQVFHAIRVMDLAPARGGMVASAGERRCMSQTARFQETLRRLAMIDEGEAGLGLGPAPAPGTSRRSSGHPAKITKDAG